MVGIVARGTHLGQADEPVILAVQIQFAITLFRKARGRPLFDGTDNERSVFDGVGREHDSLIVGPIEQFVSRAREERNTSSSA